MNVFNFLRVKVTWFTMHLQYMEKLNIHAILLLQLSRRRMIRHLPR